MIDKILIWGMYILTSCMVIAVLMFVREVWKNEKKRKEFESNLKIGDKCSIYINQSRYNAVVSDIRGDVATIQIKCFKSRLYPPKEEKSKL